ncbi:MAG: serine/threonine protein kinase [Verrucomicrobiales bacterium]|jgi:serine/threonine protein kinase
MSDRYQIQGKIGQGGLGAVYKAFDTQLKREVALKRVLTPEEGSKEEVDDAAEKLLKEATVLSSLMHPNIVTIFDIGQDDSGGFVVMELLDGETLDETIGRGLLTQRDFTEVVNQTLEAMIAAQAVPLLHRDLKPTNVMVIWRPSGKFQIKILDFGLAKISEQPSIQTIDHGDAILGSIYFMAPEQFERRKLDFRTDMYALGCIYYYSLTGKYPFDGESAPQVMAAHLQHKVKTLKEMRPDLPDEICQWVMWLINRDMTKRPGNAREALERFPGEGGGGSGMGFAPPVEEEIMEAIPVPVPESPAAAGARPKLKTGPTTSKKTATGRTSSRVPLKTSGRVPLKTGPVGGAGQTTRNQSGHIEAATQLRIEEAAKKKKLILIAIWGAAMLIIIGIVAKVIMGRLDSANIENRMKVLINADPPRGTPEDVLMLVGKLSTEDSGRAFRILSDIEGSDVAKAINEHFEQASSGAIRVKLTRILANRGDPDSFPSLLKILKTTKNTEEIKFAMLGLAKMADTSDHLKAMLPLLKEEKIAGIDRYELEWAILSTLRLVPNVENRSNDLLSILDRSTGVERRSLCKIIGAAGGKKILTKMETIFADGDLEFQTDAMAGLNEWPDRSCQKLLVSILETATDPVIKVLAVNAFARISQLPAKNTEEIHSLNRIIELAPPGKVRNDALYAIASSRPLPSTMDFLKNIANPDDSLKGLIKGIQGEVQKRLDRAVPVKSGEIILTAQGEIRGTTRRSGGWSDPNQWLQWLVQVDEPGKWRLEILSACDGPAKSKLEIIAGGEQVYIDVRRTSTWDDYVPLEAGEFEFDEAGLHIVFVRAGKHVQRRIAEIQGIRLIKIGK